MSRFINWLGILPTAIEDDSKEKAWKILTVQATVQPLSSLQLPIGKKRRLMKRVKKD
jgi:hypothetical protein